MTSMMLNAVVLALALQASASPQKLFESGRYQDIVNQVGANASPEDLVLLARANLKLGNKDAARAAYAKLQTGGANNAWRLIGDSGVAEVTGKAQAAVDAGSKAVAASPGNFYAQFQLGLARSSAKDFKGAAAAFEDAININPSFAYAHYYAGMSYYSVRQIDRMAGHFNTFSKLAPTAPERPAVENIMRSLKGR